jgi:hypothetical protein
MLRLHKEKPVADIENVKITVTIGVDRQAYADEYGETELTSLDEIADDLRSFIEYEVKDRAGVMSYMTRVEVK